MEGLPRTFYTVLIAQFISTLVDNAFLIVAIARVLELQAGAWLIPILKSWIYAFLRGVGAGGGCVSRCVS